MRNILPSLERGVQKVSDPRFPHFVPPPSLPVINDQSLGGGQGGLGVKRPPGNQKVGGSNPTTVTW